jgi:glycerol-3-phosphate O-acyltransferase
VLPAEIRLSIRQVALHRSEDAADQVAAPTLSD